MPLGCRQHGDDDWQFAYFDEELLAGTPAWDIHPNIDTKAVPDGRTVIKFVFTDVPAAARDWWIVITSDGIDVCDADPGFDVGVTVESRLRTLTLLWRGDLSWPGALRSDDLALHGEPHARRALPRWLKLSALSPTPRPALTSS